MKSRCGKAFWITVVLLLVVHVFLFIFGMFFGSDTGFLDISMFWAHWHDWGSIVISLIVAIVVYGIVYGVIGESNAE